MSVIGHFLSSEKSDFRGKVVFKNDEDFQVRIHMEFDKENGATRIFSGIIEKLLEVEAKEETIKVFPTEAELFDIITLQTKRFGNPKPLSGKKEEAINFAKQLFNNLSEYIGTISIDEDSLEQYYSI